MVDQTATWLFDTSRGCRSFEDDLSLDGSSDEDSKEADFSISDSQSQSNELKFLRSQGAGITRSSTTEKQKQLSAGKSAPLAFGSRPSPPAGRPPSSNRAKPDSPIESQQSDENEDEEPPRGGLSRSVGGGRLDSMSQSIIEDNRVNDEYDSEEVEDDDDNDEDDDADDDEIAPANLCVLGI